MSRFLKPWMDFSSRLTDAPYDFLETAGLSLLSAITLGRRWIPKGTGIHPNLFFMHVAHSTVDRKSEPIKFAMQVLEKTKDHRRIGADDFSPEGLVDQLEGSREDSRKIVFVSEFGKVLARMKKQYAADLAPILTDLYDSIPIRKKRANKKRVYIPNPQMTIYGAVAFGMLVAHLDPIEWETGFLSRMLFVPPGVGRPGPYPDQPERHMGDDAEVAGILQNMIYELRGNEREDEDEDGGDKPIQLLQHRAFRMSKAAADLKRQQLADPAYLPGSQDSEQHAAHAQRGRYETAIDKLAILYQTDIDLTAGEICPDATWRALVYVGKCWSGFMHTYRMSQADPVSRNAGKMLKLVLAAGEEGIGRRELCRQARLPIQAALSALDLLQAMKAVQRISKGRGDGFKALWESSPEDD